MFHSQFFATRRFAKIQWQQNCLKDGAAFHLPKCTNQPCKKSTAFAATEPVCHFANKRFLQVKLETHLNSSINVMIMNHKLITGEHFEPLLCSRSVLHFVDFALSSTMPSHFKVLHYRIQICSLSAQACSVVHEGRNIKQIIHMHALNTTVKLFQFHLPSIFYETVQQVKSKS